MTEELHSKLIRLSLIARVNLNRMNPEAEKEVFQQSINLTKLIAHYLLVQ